MDKWNNFTAKKQGSSCRKSWFEEKRLNKLCAVVYLSHLFWLNLNRNYYLGVEYKYSTLDKLDHSLFLSPSPEPDHVGGSGSAPGAGGDDTFSSNPNPFQTPSSVAKRTKQV